MAYDLLTKTTSGRDWSCGAGDLPEKAKGYVPDTFWSEAQMEHKLKEIMSKPKSLFGSKPSRDEAIPVLASYMHDHKIGPMTSAAGTEIGNILFPKGLSNKLDDVRYDVRNGMKGLGAGVFALAGAIAFLGFAKVYKAGRTGYRVH